MYLDRYTNKKGAFYFTGPLSGSRLHQFDENLNAALRADKYKDELFEELTGSSLEDLEKEFKDSLK